MHISQALGLVFMNVQCLHSQLAPMGGRGVELGPKYEAPPEVPAADEDEALGVGDGTIKSNETILKKLSKPKKPAISYEIKQH